MITNDILGLYIHIPFCSSICTYCDFYKMVVSNNYKDKYLSYLLKEMELKKDNFQNLKTIYIGGGTPSCLSHEQLKKLLEAINKYLVITKITEFTIEANPNDINLDFINLIKEHGVNRISLGVESLDYKKLLILNRKHDKKIVLNALKLLKDNGLDNINVDLIYGLNNERFSSIRKDIKILHKYVKHFSCYNLILEERTILYKLKQKGRFTELSEEREKKIYYKTLNKLESLGFKQYEVSNFALSGFESKHNLLYWDYSNYEALGPSASSFIDNIRKTNVKNMNLYYEGLDHNEIKCEEYESLEEEDMIKEFIMMGLRKTKGINLEEFKERFKVDFFVKFPDTRRLINKGALVYDKSFLKVAKSALFVMNEILLEYM